MKPSLVVFDLFGTLIRPGVRLHSFRNILLWARTQGRKPHPDDARTIMTSSQDSERMLATLGIAPPAEMLAQLDQDIQTELDSLTLYDDVMPALNTLSREGIALAICSNLAKPYGVAIDRLLSQFKLTQHLSYTLGAIKPEKAMYDAIISDGGVSPAYVLFVGDTLLADYQGPVAYGFQARHLVRAEPTSLHEIASLSEVLPLCAAK